ncbi:MAG: TRAP transporter fused permease subunit [Alphaproteobacteria bacterium]|nr:TRAP transporter fused permease subunit [Alphaproteobacteria bacterium]
MMVEVLDYRQLRPLPMALFGALTLAGLALVLNQLLNLQLFVGIVFIDNRYLFLVGGIFLSLVYLAYPAHIGASRQSVVWYDAVLFALTLAATGYFTWNADRILSQGWEYAAPAPAVAVSFVAWALILEGLRRTGGTAITVIVFVISLYPVYAGYMPGPIAGLPQTFGDTIAYHLISAESSFGIPMRAFGEIVVGFIVFGVVLNYTGGGKFFNDLAFALVGQWRGGAAQVGVISSGLQGSISGSVISNVISSGVVTIPAMKRTGFSAAYAGGVEAVASTGGVLMPPVMGSTAFVMASFLGIPYGEIALAAAVPALLFYFGLVIQIDAYSARRGLAGLPRDELPSLGSTMREGWVFIAVFVLLIYVMLNESQEALAPFYATALLLVINQTQPRWRFDRAKVVEVIAANGRALAELVAILLGIGFIIGAFSVTGLAGTLANDLIYIAGDRPLVLLVMGAITSFIFGMGMTVTACYIFLAIVLAPPLVKAGLDPLAVHLFIMYWGMVSFITPPVALGAFAAASLARCSAFAVGWEAVRLGSVIYFLPFFFVLNPALILKGTWPDIALAIGEAAAGIVLIAAGLQGWLIGMGDVGTGLVGLARRALLIAAGFAVAMPTSQILGLADWQGVAFGLAVLAATIGWMRAAPGQA